MASFAATTKEYVGGPNGKRMLMVRGTLTLASEGASDGDIPASLFGLSKIYSVTIAIKSDDLEAALFVINSDSDELFYVNIEQSVDSLRATRANTTASWILTVIGS